MLAAISIRDVKWPYFALWRDLGMGFANKGASLRQKGNDAMKNRKTKRTVQDGGTPGIERGEGD